MDFCVWRLGTRIFRLALQNPGEGGMFWKIHVIVAEGIVFIHSFIARAARDRRQLSGHFIGIPPRVLHQEISKREGSDCNENKPEPAAAAFDGRGEKTAADYGDDGHPSPGKWHKAHLGEKAPERGGQPEHHESGKRAEQEQASPEGTGGAGTV